MARGVLVSLTTGATTVVGAGLHGVIQVTVRNSGTGTGYLGGSDVTTAGYPITTGDSPLTLMVVPGETLYGTSTGAAVLGVLQMNETSSS